MADSLYEMLVLENMRLRIEVRSSEAKHRKAQEERDAWKRAHGDAQTLFNELYRQVTKAGHTVRLRTNGPIRVEFESAPIGEASGPGPVSLAADLSREKGEGVVLARWWEQASAERDEARKLLDEIAATLDDCHIASFRPETICYRIRHVNTLLDEANERERIAEKDAASWGG